MDRAPRPAVQPARRVAGGGGGQDGDTLAGVGVLEEHLIDGGAVPDVAGAALDEPGDALIGVDEEGGEEEEVEEVEEVEEDEEDEGEEGEEGEAAASASGDSSSEEDCAGEGVADGGPAWAEV